MHESAVGDRFDSNLNGSTRGWKDMRGARRRGLASSSARCPAVHRNWRQKGENDMGLYKICEHKGRARDRCEHAWWGSFRGRRVSLARWANCEVRSKAKADAVLDELRKTVRAGTFDERGLEPPREASPLTFSNFAE